jgi:hypothetical protein
VAKVVKEIKVYTRDGHAAGMGWHINGERSGEGSERTRTRKRRSVCSDGGSILGSQIDEELSNVQISLVIGGPCTVYKGQDAKKVVQRVVTFATD